VSASSTIGFAGLSHLGIIYSAATIAKGFPVVAFDARPGLALEISNGHFPVSEPGLEQLVAENRALVSYTDDVSALAACGLIFVALDIATDENNNSDLGPLEALLQKLFERASKNTTLVILSQVPPGFCRKLCSRLRTDLNLYYQVETLVFGNAVERAVHPERYMVGSAEPNSEIPDLYRQFLEAFNCPLLMMRYESAELCKIAINCFLVSSVTTSNTLAEVCEKIGANWSELVPALRLDKRIGPHAYLNAGLGIAGGNLERDLVTIRNLAAEHGTDAGIVKAWQENSTYRKDWVLRNLFMQGLLTHRGETILGVWGVSYKVDTHSIKNSPSIALMQALKGFNIQAYDPAARWNPLDYAGVKTCDSELDAAKGADALVVMTPWKEFSQVSLEHVRQAMRGRDVLDPYGALDESICKSLGFRYRRLGSQEK
jgi:UDPglucose 6-dehydrogenase